MAKRNPTQTRQHILDAALGEFAARGYDGARVDTIAAKAGANKRMLYHYFGNKDDLYLAVLECTYEHIRSHERDLDLEAMNPEQAMGELVRFTFGYFVAHPEFIRILNNENLYGAQHLTRSSRITDMHSPLVEQVHSTLARGAKLGVFRRGVDPVQLYITIAGLGYFYLSNAATLGAIFERDLREQKALAARADHIVEVVLGYLRP
jgi:TetR/AcrR family transcriptional regulator